MDRNVSFRLIQKKDNSSIAHVIRKVLEEHGENKPGTVYTDPTTDQLYELFQTKGSVYFVAEVNGHIIGGCGVYPTHGLPKGYGELVKLYLDANHRNIGVGKKLMEKSILWAKKNHYSHLYLESIPALNKAVDLYKHLGFEKINHRLGESGHFACNLWMVKKLDE